MLHAKFLEEEIPIEKGVHPFLNSIGRKVDKNRKVPFAKKNPKLLLFGATNN